MNNKVYRLLRNNKEQGPFTADELIQKNLKLFDLIWVDGRSAAWSYPSEIAEFKSYVPDAAEKTLNSFAKIPATTSRISASVQAAVSVNDIIIKNDAPKQKPRYKISAAWSKIQTITTPDFNNVIIAEPKKNSSSKIIDTNNKQVINVKSLSWEQAWNDWETEKKSGIPAKAITAQMLPVNKPAKVNQHTTATPVLEKKFEQSLDTITNNYIDNILQQKKKSKGFAPGKTSEFILPSLALVIIFSIAYWVMHNTKVVAVTNALPAQPQQSISVSPNKKEPLNVNAEPVNNNQTVLPQTLAQNKEENTTAVNKPAVKSKTPAHYIINTNFNVPAKKDNAVNNTAEKSVQTKAPDITDVDLKKPVKPIAKQFDPSVINNVPKDNASNDASTVNNNDLNAAANRPVRRRTNVTDAGQTNQSANQPAYNTPVIKNVNTNKGLSYVTVPKYISMVDGSGNLKIQNVSDVNLDLAVVDVQYYDASGRFRKGETLYLHNLRAGKTVNIKTAKDVNSAYATSKVSLVSSDSNGVYAVGDN